MVFWFSMMVARSSLELAVSSYTATFKILGNVKYGTTLLRNIRSRIINRSWDVTLISHLSFLVPTKKTNPLDEDSCLKCICKCSNDLYALVFTMSHLDSFVRVISLADGKSENCSINANLRF